MISTIVSIKASKKLLIGGGIVLTAVVVISIIVWLRTHTHTTNTQAYQTPAETVVVPTKDSSANTANQKNTQADDASVKKAPDPSSTTPPARPTPQQAAPPQPAPAPPKAAPAPPQPAQPAPAPAPTPAISHAGVLAVANAERGTLNVSALAHVDTLSHSAEEQAKYVAARHSLTHEGGLERLTQHTPACASSRHAEIMQMLPAGSSNQSSIENWRTSATHHTLLTSADMHKAGVGIVRGSNGFYYVVMHLCQ